MTFSSFIVSESSADWALRIAGSSVIVAGLTIVLSVLLRRHSLPLQHSLLACGLAVVAALPALLAVVNPPLATTVQVAIDDGTEGFFVPFPSRPGPDETSAGPEFPLPSPASSQVDLRYGEERSTALDSNDEGSVVSRDHESGRQNLPRPAERMGEPQSSRAQVSDSSKRSHAASAPPQPALILGSIGRVSLNMLVFVWAAGSCIYSIRIARALALLIRIRRTGKTVADARCILLASQAAQATGLREVPVMICSARIDVPVSTALLRPVIILPDGFASGLSDADLHAILIHECAHAARRDHWIGMLQQFVACFLWWNPLVHGINRRIRTLREHLCDNFVARSGGRSREYAQLLVRLAEQLIESRLLRVGMPLLPRRRGLLESRVRSLLDDHESRAVVNSRRGRAVVLVLTVALTLAGVLTGFQLQARELEEGSNPASTDSDSRKPGDNEAAKEREKTSSDDAESKGEELKTIEAKLETLDVAMARAKKSYEKLKTWSGEGTLVVEQNWPRANGGKPRLLRRRARFRFDVDFTNARVFASWRDLQPPNVLDAESTRPQVLSSNLFLHQNLLTKKRWLDFQSGEFINQPKPAVFSFNASKLARVVYEKSNPDRNHMRLFHAMIDPRDWFGTSIGHVTDPTPLFWDELKMLKDYREKKLKEGEKEPINRLLGVHRRGGRNGFVITASRHYYQGDGPDRKLSKTHEVDFQERYDFLMTRCVYRKGLGQIEEEALIDYENVNGTFVPKMYRYHQTDDGRGLDRTVHVSLTRNRVNHELRDEDFTESRFDLRDGDRMRNKDANAFYEWKDKQFVEIKPPDRPSSMEWSRIINVDMRPIYQAGTEWNSLLKDWIEVYRVRDDPDRHADLARRYVALAKNSDDNSERSYRSLEQVVKSEFAGQAAMEAADMILRDHLLHRSLPRLVTDLQIGMPPSAAAGRLLRGIVEKGPTDQIKAAACVELGRFLHRQANRVRMLNAFPGRDEQIRKQYGKWYVDHLQDVEPAEIEAEAEHVLQRVINEFPKERTRDGKGLLKTQADSLLFRVRNLSIGRKAPGIEGHDIDGNEMRLQTYGNRVRVVLFWGHWARRTHTAYPLYRRLIEKYDGEPFVFLGVSSDQKPETLRPLVAKNEITWDFWHDGRIQGPIHRQWNAMWSVPTIFILDQDGIIRFKGLRDDELETAIDSLLNKTASD